MELLPVHRCKLTHTVNLYPYISRWFYTAVYKYDVNLTLLRDASQDMTEIVKVASE